MRMRIRAGKVLTDSYKHDRRYRFTIPSTTCNKPQLASLAGERDVVPELYCSYVGRCTPCIGFGVERCSRQGTKASIIIHVHTV